MSIVGEAALSFLFETLLERFFSQSEELLKLARKHGQLVGEIRKWEQTFRNIQAVLQDAEEKQLKNPQVRAWLEDVEYLACDAENILEDFYHEFFSQDESRWIFNAYAKYSPNALWFKRRMTSRLSLITSRLKDLMERKQQLDLFAGNGSYFREAFRRPPSGPFSAEPCIYGRTAEIQKVVRFLVTDEGEGKGKEKIGVIPIVGMGGLGKTTLAQFVYDDEVVKGCFDVRAWVCVSKDYDMMRITKGILEAVTSTSCSLQDQSAIQDELHDTLTGKKFLLVLDDLWNESYGNWQALCAPLKDAAPGSKIIVTTRNAKVADAVRTVETNELLAPLTDDDCWALFCRHAGLDMNENLNSRFEEIGRNIARKCSGLPLAAMTLGGILRWRETAAEWEDVLNSKSWRTNDDGEVEIRSVLKISYFDLPSHLKRCFALCSVFPKGYKFYEKEVVLLWLGAGLIPWDGTRLDAKQRGLEIGHVYFRELVSRSIFLPFNESRYYIHDLFRDVAQEASGSSCCSWDGVEKMTELRRIPWDRTLHFSVNHLKLGAVVHEFGGLLQTQKTLPLRTFYRLFPMSLVIHDHRRRYLDITPLLKLKYLRILSLTYSLITELPKSISKWKHLRYLDISYTNVWRLPKTTVSLRSLEILNLGFCNFLTALPRDIGNLKNLRYIDASYTGITRLPFSISSLHNLEILILFSCESLDELPEDFGNLTNLRYLDLMATCISTLPESTMSLKKLEYLLLGRCSFLGALPPSIGDLKNLMHLDISYGNIHTLPESLAALRNLDHFDMSCCKRIVGLPASIGSLTNMKHLNLSSINIDALPSSLTSLYSLEVLDLSDIENLKELPADIGNLRQLKQLDLSSTSVSMLPITAASLLSLEDLDLSFCLNLRALPTDIGNLTHLRRLNVSYTAIQRLPLSATSLQALEALDLSYCDHLEELPADIGDLKQLRTLKLLHCNISRLPASATELCSLEVLELNYCKRILELPSDIGRLRSLRILNLSSCGIRSLPESVMCLCNLEVVDVRLCEYLGELSPELRTKVKNLFY